MSHTDDYVFDDGDESTGKDKFEREPFIVRFKGFHTCKMSIFNSLRLWHVNFEPGTGHRKDASL